VGRALGAALDPETENVKAAHLALKLIAEADPAQQSQVELSGEISPEAVDNLGLGALVALAERLELTPAETS